METFRPCPHSLFSHLLRLRPKRPILDDQPGDPHKLSGESKSEAPPLSQKTRRGRAAFLGSIGFLGFLERVGVGFGVGFLDHALVVAA
jgi:hypothetical protein